jgi:small subunit ribosomal protein S6
MEKKQIIKKYEDKENCIKKKCIFAAQNYNQIYKQKQSTIMLNHYETVFIMTPVLSDEQMKETVKKFENFLLEKGAEIVHQENWGLRKLEYPIAKKTSGFYHLFEFKAEGSVVKEYELQYRRDEKIMRYLTVALDKHAIAYSEKRRNLRKEKEATKEQ